jgi:hypothetical protein
MLGLLVIWISIDRQSVEGFDMNVYVFGKAMNNWKS